MSYLFAIPLLYLIQRVVLRRRVIITHRETFTLGFLWYGAMPIAASVVQLPTIVPELRFWQSIATLMGPNRVETLTIWCVLVWVAFILGCTVVRQPDKTFTQMPVCKNASKSWRLVLISVSLAAAFFAVVWAISNRGILFRGYADTYDDATRGPLQAALIYTSVAFVIALLMRRDIARLPVFLVGFVAIGLGLLSLSVGTRSMPVLITVMLVALISRLRGGISRILLLVSVVLALAGFSALAAWRQGGGDFRFALLTPALEPLYTYISAASYLAFNEIPLIAFPDPLLGSLANLVPRVAWPEKVEFVDSLTENIKIFAPLGATHLFVSLLINFGWIGGVIVSFSTGIGIEKLSRCRGPVLMASYALVVAVLATDIWRNPFSQSLIKSVLQGAFLVPALLFIIATLLRKSRGRGGTASSSDVPAFAPV